MSIAAGIDVDEACRYPFEHNNGAPFIRADVSKLSGRRIARLFEPDATSILVGCAPCQPFSVYNQKNSDPRWQLLGHFSRIISEVRPTIVSMENVPALLRFQGGRVFDEFKENLERCGYHVFSKIVVAADYGVPQTRHRLVVLASRLGPIDLIAPTHTTTDYVTVRDAIGVLPKLAAGAADPIDQLHRASRLSRTNLERIRASRQGGTWRDWDAELVTTCHTKLTGKGYSSVYGRMVWDEPSPTITTQFFGFGNGRFGHPKQSRAISLREGAILQSFPRDYRFVEPGKVVRFKAVGRLIGNAVPVKLGQAIAKSIRLHLKNRQ
jgi:DNA (cytosine-5)-methyltransferase 1